MTDEQLELIDVGPENMEEIKPAAQLYQKAKMARIKATDREVKTKTALLKAVKAAKLGRLEDGSIRFRCDGMLISITPRDELVKVKEDEE
jgi:hypothetical protein